ncbi:hypothetical protein ACFYOT_27075 [Saccharothrix saharensis]|uniref:hypothetical protein n=1 Tax=Saccharothrix saharensis TaxID=571190 RepID=UPI003682CCDE
MPDVLGSVWRRRLDVRVRRVAGKLALKSPTGTVAVPSGSTWLWTELDGRSTVAGLCERVGVPVERVAAAFRDMVDAGVVERVGSPVEDSAGERVVVHVGGSSVLVTVVRAAEGAMPSTREGFEGAGRRAADAVCAEVVMAGVRPTGCVVDLTVPEDVPPGAVGWVRDGLRTRSAVYGVSLAEGGVRTGPWELVGSAWGVAPADRVVGRVPVRPGDAVVVADDVEAVLECARRGLLAAGAAGGVDRLAAVVAERTGGGVELVAERDRGEVELDVPVDGPAFAFTVPADRLDEAVSVLGRSAVVGRVRAEAVP